MMSGWASKHKSSRWWLAAEYIAVVLFTLSFYHVASGYGSKLEGLKEAKSNIELLHQTNDLLQYLSRAKSDVANHTFVAAVPDATLDQLKVKVASSLQLIEEQLNAHGELDSKKIVNMIRQQMRQMIRPDGTHISPSEYFHEIDRLVAWTSMLVERIVYQFRRFGSGVLSQSFYAFAMLKNIDDMQSSIDKIIFYTHNKNGQEENKTYETLLINEAYLKFTIAVDEMSLRLAEFEDHNKIISEALWNPKKVQLNTYYLREISKWANMGDEGLQSLHQFSNDLHSMSTNVVSFLSQSIDENIAEVATARIRSIVTLLTVVLLLSLIFAFLYNSRSHAMRERLENDSKTRFLAKMSHEIRTPMNGVMGVAELLAKTSLNSEQMEYVSVIKSSGSTLLAVIDDILDYSKIEAGKVQLESVPLDFYHLIQKSAKIFGYKAMSKGLFLFMAKEPKMPQLVLGDPTRLQQIMNNLLGNAVKFTAQGSITIEVCCRKINQSEALFTVAVEDTGIGISKENRALVFEQFTQAKDDTTRKYGGTGLGLTITRQLVDLMDGSIRVDSVEGEGSIFTFEVTLPIITDYVPSEHDHSASHLMNIVLLDPSNRLTKLTQRGARFIPENFTCIHDPSDAALRVMLADRHYDALVAVVDVSNSQEMNIFRKVELAAMPDIKGLLANSLHLTKSADSRLKEFDFILVKPVVSFEGIIASLEPGFSSDSIGAGSFINKEMIQGMALVAEDNAVNQMVIKCMLKELHYTADVVENGEIALNRYCQSPDQFDVVLLDCDMPVMDGFECTSRIRAFEASHKRQPIPIYTVSAHVLPEIVQKGKEVGVDGHLNKPVTLSNLQDILQDSVRIRKEQTVC